MVVRNRWTATDAQNGKKVSFGGIVFWRIASDKLPNACISGKTARSVELSMLELLIAKIKYLNPLCPLRHGASPGLVLPWN